MAVREVLFSIVFTKHTVLSSDFLLNSEKQLKDIGILSTLLHMRKDFPTKAFSNLIMLIELQKCNYRKIKNTFTGHYIGYNVKCKNLGPSVDS